MTGQVLVVAAHPDDAELGVGGTVARLSRSGVTITLGFLADGVSSRWDASVVETKVVSSVVCQRSRTNKVRQEIEAALGARWGAALEAARSLGATLAELADPGKLLPDQQMDAFPLLKVVKLVEALVSMAKPDVIYTHSLADLNRDHRVTAEAVMVATRPAPGSGVRVVYAFETPSATEWGFGRFGEFRPTVYQEIGPVDWGAKMTALGCYKEEMRPYPHPRSVEAIEALARCRGAQVGVEMAEAFELIREVRYQ